MPPFEVERAYGFVHVGRPICPSVTFSFPINNSRTPWPTPLKLGQQRNQNCFSNNFENEFLHTLVQLILNWLVHLYKTSVTSLVSQDLAGLQQLHKALTSMKKDSQNDNIASVLLGDRSGLQAEDDSEATSEASVLRALEDKYDAMRDKVMIEVT